MASLGTQSKSDVHGGEMRDEPMVGGLAFAVHSSKLNGWKHLQDAISTRKDQKRLERAARVAESNDKTEREAASYVEVVHLSEVRTVGDSVDYDLLDRDAQSLQDLIIELTDTLARKQDAVEIDDAQEKLDCEEAWMRLRAIREHAETYAYLPSGVASITPEAQEMLAAVADIEDLLQAIESTS